MYLKVNNLEQSNKKLKITIKNKVKHKISILDKRKFQTQKDWFYIRKAKN